MPARSRPHFPVLDLDITAVSPCRALAEIRELAVSGAGGYACFTNVHVAVLARQQPAVRRALHEADFVFPDGAPLCWLGRRRAGAAAHRIAGPDFLAAMFEDPAGRTLRHYFYGSTPETLARLLACLRARYPGCRIVGADAPPFRPLTERESEAALARIRASAAQIVWVGLGAPRQELWMQASRAGLPGCMLLGVGAAFDLHAGLRRRAPRLLQRLGLEWLYRLCQEPRRLWRRYAETNALFLAWTLRDWLRARRR